MSQENVEIIRRDFEVGEPSGEGERLDQARPFFEDFGDTFESIRVEPKEFIEVDDYVIVPQAGYTRGRDGIETTARITLVWTIRDGAIARIYLYQDKQDALEAAGLRSSCGT